MITSQGTKNSPKLATNPFAREAEPCKASTLTNTIYDAKITATKIHAIPPSKKRAANAEATAASGHRRDRIAAQKCSGQTGGQAGARKEESNGETDSLTRW